MLQGARRQRFLEREIQAEVPPNNLPQGQMDSDGLHDAGGLGDFDDDLGEKAFGAT